MGDLSKLFIKEFHSLPGDTVNEKRRNLFLLFRKHGPALTENKQELEFITTNLKPTSYLEKHLRIDFLIHFRRFEELFQAYINGDGMVLVKVKKQSWFFQNVLKNVKTEEFINDILPKMPYSVKLKILNKLFVEAKQADEIFDAVHKRYGIFFATTLLPKCTPSKIEETLKSHCVKLTPSQLECICHKDPSLMYVYFEELTKHEGNALFMDNNPVLVCLARESPEIFTKLFNKFQFETQLGYKTTKKYIDSQQNEILGKVESYLYMLNRRAIVQSIGYELKSIFFKLSQTIGDVPYWQLYLPYYPKSQRYNVFKSFYHFNFGHEFGENLDLVTEEMLNIVPDSLEREKLAQMKLEKEKDEKYLKYVTSGYCLKEFRERFSELNKSEKVNYVKYATQCCILNEDFDSLLQLCELVARQLQNEIWSITEEFLLILNCSSVDFEKFNENHWTFISEIIDSAEAKGQTTFYHSTIRTKYLKFLINNDKPIGEIISKFSDWIDIIEWSREIINSPKICRKIFAELIGLKHAEQELIVDNDVKLVYFYKKLSRKYPEYATQILNNPRILQTFKNILENELHLCHDSAMKHMICRKDSVELLEELKLLYFKQMEKFGETSVCLWFLKHEPRTFQKHLNYFLQHCVRIFNFDRKKIWSRIRNYTHLGLDKEIYEKLKEEHTLKREFVEALTILSPSESHLEFVKSYVPTCFKIELQEDGSESPSTFRCNLVNFLHLTDSPADVLPIALEFCKGDYLKYALRPLYSSVYKLPEYQMRSVIEKLNEDEEDAVKKHAIYLGCVVLDAETIQNYLKDPTMPSLKAVSKYFVKNPSDFLWEVTKTKLKKRYIGKEDFCVIQWIMNTTFHLEYKTKFVEAIWALRSRNGMVDAKMDELNIVKSLHPDIVYKLIENFFKMREPQKSVKLLTQINDDRKYEFVSNMLKDFKDNFWSCETTQREARRKLTAFIRALAEDYFESKDCQENFAVKFSNVFTSIFCLTEAFEEYIMVSLMKLKGETAENCAKALVELNNSLVTDYGRSITNLFGKSVKESVLPVLKKNNLNDMEICYFVFKHNKSLDDYSLVINILPQHELKGDDHKMYDEILHELEKMTDEFISLQLNLYLKTKQSSIKSDDNQSIKTHKGCKNRRRLKVKRTY